MIIPHNRAPEELGAYLKKSQAQLLVAEAGAVDLTVVSKGNAQLKHVIWVVKQGSRHMDWSEVPDGIGGNLDVSVWHETVNEKKQLSDTEVPASEPKSTTPSILAVWPLSGEFIEYKPQVSWLELEPLLKLIFIHSRISCLVSVLFLAPFQRPSDLFHPTWCYQLTRSHAHTHYAGSWLPYTPIRRLLSIP